MIERKRRAGARVQSIIGSSSSSSTSDSDSDSDESSISKMHMVLCVFDKKEFIILLYIIRNKTSISNYLFDLFRLRDVAII